MKKTLGIMLLDETDANLWKNNILYNITKFDHLIIGCIGFRGPTISSLDAETVHIIDISDSIYTSKATTDSSLRNKLTNIVHSDSKFSDIGFILNIDSDERIIGNLPTWDSSAYSHGANCLYNYEYPFRNSRWLGCCAFFGRSNPTWLGDYHNAPSSIGAVHISNQFMIVHDRNTEQRRHHPVTDIMKYLSDDYYSRIAMIKNILDLKPPPAHHLKYAVDSMRNMPSIPGEITGLYLKMYQVQELMVRYKLSLITDDITGAKQYANELLAHNQRVGIVYLWILQGRTNSELMKNQYRKFDISTPQFIDILDDSKLW